MEGIAKSLFPRFNQNLNESPKTHTPKLSRNQRNNTQIDGLKKLRKTNGSFQVVLENVPKMVSGKGGDSPI